MKFSVFGLSTKQTVGLLVGVIGLLIPPIFLSLPGLSFAGHITLGIFLMAAIFWMTEPIPIYATSMSVIFLQVLLLSAQGPVYQDAELPVTSIDHIENETWQIPPEALTEHESVWIVRDDETKHIEDLRDIQKENDIARISSPSIQEDDSVITDPWHRKVDYEPTSYEQFFGTLANPIIILFLGGFMLAAGAVKYKLDRNLTRYLLKPFGTRPLYIVLGLMLVTAVLSAFMSNTATTAMMMTVILPIIAQLETGDRFKIGLALSIPFAANIGGILTPIGTPPNAIVLAAIQDTGRQVSFTDWMMYTTPVVVIMLLAAWWILLKVFKPSIENFNLNMKGEFLTSPKAIILYFIFGITVLLWITENQHGVSSNMVAFFPIAGLIATGVLDKDDIRTLPWEVLWLVAGGISLGLSMDQTGLAMWMISGINWAALGAFALVFTFGLISIGLSNFLSNTVTATLVMPLGISLWSAGVLPEPFGLITIGLVISVSCSLAMILPISTPPNAIAMSTGILRTPDMAKGGLIIGIIGLIIVIANALIYWPLLLN